MAIFFALGVGLLIGSTMMVRDTLLEKQQQLILRMEKDFHQLREENKELLALEEDLEDALSKEREGLELLLALFLEEQLAHLRLYIDNGKGVDLERTDLPSILSLAGAELVERGDDFHVCIRIGDQGEVGEDGGISIKEDELYLPQLLGVILELMVIEKPRESHGLNTSLQ